MQLTRNSAVADDRAATGNYNDKRVMEGAVDWLVSPVRSL